MERRALLLAGGACLAGAGLYGWRALTPSGLDLVDRPGVEGFYGLRGGGLGLSGAGAALAGLEAAPAFTGDPHAALFARRGGAPIAIFTDYRCPNCRRMAAETLRWARDPALAVSFHDWPILGPASQLAARAAVAAAQQGRAGYLALHERLMETSFLPTPGWLRESAPALGLDPDRLLIGMEASATAATLARADALARRLGLIGTPSFVFADVVAEGALSPSHVRALLDRAKSA